MIIMLGEYMRCYELQQQQQNQGALLRPTWSPSRRGDECIWACQDMGHMCFPRIELFLKEPFNE
jgi:hypothetical protein